LPLSVAGVILKPGQFGVDQYVYDLQEHIGRNRSEAAGPSQDLLRGYLQSGANGFFPAENFDCTP
jgi:hypothetical protein